MGFKSSYFICFLLGLSLLTSCTGQQGQASVTNTAYEIMLNTLLSRDVPEIDVKELSIISSSPILLDARELVEYNVSHLKNARFVGYDSFDINTLNDLDKTQEIVVYCSIGYRSEQITKQLCDQGYSNVRNLYGGIFEWKNQSQEVVDTLGKKTDNIHSFNKQWGMWLKKGKKIY